MEWSQNDGEGTPNICFHWLIPGPHDQSGSWSSSDGDRVIPNGNEKSWIVTDCKVPRHTGRTYLARTPLHECPLRRQRSAYLCQRILQSTRSQIPTKAQALRSFGAERSDRGDDDQSGCKQGIQRPYIHCCSTRAPVNLRGLQQSTSLRERITQLKL